MFDWIKDCIINDASVIATDVTDRLLVKRGGEYLPTNIAEQKVYKTAGYRGTNSQIVIDCSSISVAGEATDLLLQATLKIKMFNKFLGEYANANWALFGKPILAGFEIAASSTAKDVADALYQALFDAVPENNRFMTVELDDTNPVVTITLADCYADFESFALEVYDTSATCESCLGAYVPVKFADGKITITHNREPFATGEWIRENLRFPSYPNMRYAPMYADEQPIPGAVYNMYAFKYVVPEIGHGGLSFVGQQITSDTTHVFYVLDGAPTTAFEAQLSTLSLTVVDDHDHATNDGVTGVEEPLHPNTNPTGATEGVTGATGATGATGSTGGQG